MSTVASPDDLEGLEELAAESMVDLAYTYKTFFKMARWSYTISTIMNVIMIVAAVGLFDSLFRQTLPEAINIYLAGGIAVFSVLNQAMNFDKKGSQYEQTADAYNTLFKEFREFRSVTVPNEEVPIDEKRNTLQHLIDRQQELNELTPSTWDRAYNRLDDDDVLGNIEVTEEEQQRI